MCVCTPRYLEYVPIAHTEPAQHNFLWGPRAEVEVSKAKILQFVAQVSIKLLGGTVYSDVICPLQKYWNACVCLCVWN